MKSLFTSHSNFSGYPVIVQAYDNNTCRISVYYGQTMIIQRVIPNSKLKDTLYTIKELVTKRLSA